MSSIQYKQDFTTITTGIAMTGVPLPGYMYCQWGNDVYNSYVLYNSTWGKNACWEQANLNSWSTLIQSGLTKYRDLDASIRTNNTWRPHMFIRAGFAGPTQSLGPRGGYFFQTVNGATWYAGYITSDGMTFVNLASGPWSPIANSATIRMRAVGNEITVWYNGAWLCTFNDNTYADGWVGWGGYLSANWFGDVVVTDAIDIVDSVKLI